MEFVFVVDGSIYSDERLDNNIRTRESKINEKKTVER